MEKEEFMKELREIGKKKIKAFKIYQKELSDAFMFEEKLIKKYTSNDTNTHRK